MPQDGRSLPLLLLASLTASVVHALELRPPLPTVGCVQTTLSFTPPRRGCHLITAEVVEALGGQLVQFQHGMCNLFVQHMTCSLTIMGSDTDLTTRDGAAEDARDVRESSVLGVSLDVPIMRGALALGPSQDIYLCEEREAAAQDGVGAIIVITAQGELARMVRALEVLPRSTFRAPPTTRPPDPVDALCSRSYVRQVRSTLDPNLSFPVYRQPDDARPQRSGEWPRWGLPDDLR